MFFAINILETREKLDRRIGLGVAEAQPDYHSLCQIIDFTHHLNMSTPLIHITLVDADCVDPYTRGSKNIIGVL